MCIPRAILAAGVLLLSAAVFSKLPAQELRTKFGAVRARPGAVQPAGTKRALILCGHPGDSDHRKTFAETIEKLRKALVERYEFPEGEIRVQFGALVAEAEGPVVSGVRGGATREEIEAEVADLRKAVRPEDTLWVIVMGHSHYDGRHSQFNIPGPDINEQELAKLFAGLEAREQVFFLTIPASGFYIKPMSAKGRVIITATEPDLEVNETYFPHALAEVLASPPAAQEFDVDRDGRLTLFDLYITVARNIAQKFVDDELLPTEHALLDDNGDGRGTELQLDYLTVPQGGRAKPGSKRPAPPRETADGAFAIQIVLPAGAEKPAEPVATPAETAEPQE